MASEREKRLEEALRALLRCSDPARTGYGFFRDNLSDARDGARKALATPEPPEQTEGGEVWREVYASVREVLGREPSLAAETIAREAMKATLRARFSAPTARREPCVGSIADALEADYPMLHVEADPEDVVRAVLRLQDEVEHPTARRVSAGTVLDAFGRISPAVMTAGQAAEMARHINRALGIEIEGEEGDG